MHAVTSKSEPPPSGGTDESSVHEQHALNVLRSDRLVYAKDIARALNTPRDRWTTRRARRFLRRSKIGFRLGEEDSRAPWATTWAAFFRHYQQLATETLRGMGGMGECPWCGRGDDPEDA